MWLSALLRRPNGAKRCGKPDCVEPASERRPASWRRGFRALQPQFVVAIGFWPTQILNPNQSKTAILALFIKNARMKITRFFWYGLFALPFLLNGCAEAPTYPIEPVIEFQSLNRTEILQSRNNISKIDTLIITFSFTDGDGDLGDQDSINIFMTDSRDGFTHSFKVNPIPQLGSGDGIAGDIAIKLTNSPTTKYFCCTFPNTNLTCIASEEFPVDEMYYTIQIRDRAGNLSNTIRTDPIRILCQ